MKKSGILNRDISEVIAGLGHKDMLVVCDAGLPVPDSVRRIDLAVLPGIIAFIPALSAVLQEVEVEHVYMSAESLSVSPDMQSQVARVVGSEKVEFVPHERFKELTKQAKAVIRTGEFTPYSSVILVAGCVY